MKLLFCYCFVCLFLFYCVYLKKKGDFYGIKKLYEDIAWNLRNSIVSGVPCLHQQLAFWIYSSWQLLPFFDRRIDLLWTTFSLCIVFNFSCLEKRNHLESCCDCCLGIDHHFLILPRTFRSIVLTGGE